MPRPKRGSPLRHLVLVALLSAGTACYGYRVAAPGPVSPGVTEPKGEVLWSFIWGLLQEYPNVDNCQGQGMAEVKATTNFGFVLLTVATLGLASPMKVEWRCAPPTPPEGRIPPAADAMGHGSVGAGFIRPVRARGETHP